MDVLQEWTSAPSRREMIARLNAFVYAYADRCSNAEKAERVRMLSVPLY